MGMAEAPTTSPRRDGAATAASRLHTDEHRAVPVPEGLILDLSSQAHRLGHRLMIFNELNLATAGAPIDHRGPGRDAEDELLIEGSTDGRPRKFAHQRLRGAEHAPARTAHILSIDEEAGVAAGDLGQRIVDGIEHIGRLW